MPSNLGLATWWQCSRLSCVPAQFTGKHSAFASPTPSCTCHHHKKEGVGVNTMIIENSKHPVNGGWFYCGQAWCPRFPVYCVLDPHSCTVLPTAHSTDQESGVHRDYFLYHPYTLGFYVIMPMRFVAESCYLNGLGSCFILKLARIAAGRTNAT